MVVKWENVCDLMWFQGVVKNMTHNCVQQLAGDVSVVLKCGGNVLKCVCVCV